MTEKFEKMIEYQSLDMELRKINREYNKLPQKKKLDVARNKFVEATNKLDANSAEAETLGAEVEKIYADYKNLMASFNEIEKKYNSAESDEEKAGYLSRFESLRSKIESCKGKIDDRIERIKRLTHDCKQQLALKKTVKEEYDKLKVKLEAFREKTSPDRKRIEDKLKELEPQIDGAILTTYKRFKSDGIAPVFVPVVGDDEKSYSCICGMQLSQTNKSELKNRSVSQCETCRRLVYLK